MLPLPTVRISTPFHCFTSHSPNGTAPEQITARQQHPDFPPASCFPFSLHFNHFNPYARVRRLYPSLFVKTAVEDAADFVHIGLYVLL